MNEVAIMETIFIVKNSGSQYCCLKHRQNSHLRETPKLAFLILGKHSWIENSLFSLFRAKFSTRINFVILCWLKKVEMIQPLTDPTRLVCTKAFRVLSKSLADILDFFVTCIFVSWYYCNMLQVMITRVKVLGQRCLNKLEKGYCILPIPHICDFTLCKKQQVGKQGKCFT